MVDLIDSIENYKPTFCRLGLKFDETSQFNYVKIESTLMKSIEENHHDGCFFVSESLM